MTRPSPRPASLGCRPSGFSLIEVVIAVGIAAFCLVALMSLLAVSMNTSRDSSNATADSLLFQKVINQLRVASVESHQDQASVAGDDDRFPLPAAGETGSKTFTVDEYNRYLNDGADTGDPDAARVVTVSVMTPAPFEQENAVDPVALAAGADGGKVAAVHVTVKPAHGLANEASGLNLSVFSTELNLAAQ